MDVFDGCALTCNVYMQQINQSRRGTALSINYIPYVRSELDPTKLDREQAFEKKTIGIFNLLKFLICSILGSFYIVPEDCGP